MGSALGPSTHTGFETPLLVAAAAIVAATAFGVLHGAVHGAEIAGPAGLPAAGMLIGSALLHGFGYAAGTVSAPRVARAGGVAAAVLGVALLAA